MAQYPHRKQRRRGQGKHPAYHLAACYKYQDDYALKEQGTHLSFRLRG